MKITIVKKAEAKNAAPKGRSSRGDRNRNTQQRGKAWKQRCCSRYGEA